MLDLNELSKYFTKSQQQDMIDMDISCMQNPPGRIRRARVRKVKPDHIPRPVNSFMSYRTEKQSIIRKFCPTANHRDISRMVAKWWHNVGSHEKDIFVEKAKAAKDAHNEQYPDYIFRPKAKRSKKSIVKNAEPVNQTQDNSFASSSARTRPFVKPATAIKSRLHQSNGNYESLTSVQFNNNDAFNATYNNDLVYNGSNMFTDEVLFQTKEDAANTSNFWGAYLSNEQVILDSLSGLNEAQNPNCGLSSHDSMFSPATFTLGDANVNSLNYPTNMASNINNSFFYNSSYDQNLSKNNMHSRGYVNRDGQLFSQFDCEVTPQSQAMSTPRLNHPNSPLSPLVDALTFFENQKNMKHEQLSDQFCDYQNNSMFDISLPTDVLSPSITTDVNFGSSLSNNVNIKYDNASLLDDFDFWGSSIL